MKLVNISSAQLRRAATIQDRIEQLQSELSGILGGKTSVEKSPTKKKRRKMSAAARAKISVAAKARWAKWKKTGKK